MRLFSCRVAPQALLGCTPPALPAPTAHCLDDTFAPGLCLLEHTAWQPDFCLGSDFLAKSSRHGRWAKRGDWRLVNFVFLCPMCHLSCSVTAVHDSLEVRLGVTPFLGPKHPPTPHPVQPNSSFRFPLLSRPTFLFLWFLEH